MIVSQRNPGRLDLSRQGIGLESTQRVIQADVTMDRGGGADQTRILDHNFINNTSSGNINFNRNSSMIDIDDLASVRIQNTDHMTMPAGSTMGTNNSNKMLASGYQVSVNYS